MLLIVKRRWTEPKDDMLGVAVGLSNYGSHSQVVPRLSPHIWEATGLGRTKLGCRPLSLGALFVCSGHGNQEPQAG